MTSAIYDRFNDFRQFSFSLQDADFAIFDSVNFPLAKSASAKYRSTVSRDPLFFASIFYNKETVLIEFCSAALQCLNYSQ